MFMRKNICIILAILFFTSFCFGCKKEKVNTKPDYDLSAYTSEYTKCIENKDGTYSFYVYSSPVNYKDGTQYYSINNGLKKSNYLNYKYENIANDVKTYYPLKIENGILIQKGEREITLAIKNNNLNYQNCNKISYKNKYGQLVDAIEYKNNEYELIFYTINSGIKVEIVISKPLKNNVNVLISSNSREYDTNSFNYTILKTESNLDAKINYSYAVLRKNNVENPIFNINSIIETKVDSNVILTIKKDSVNNLVKKGTLILDPSCSFYKDKIPDTSVYSNLQSINAYLNDYVALGNSDFYGESIHYFRLRANYIANFNPNIITSAKFYTKNLTSNYLESGTSNTSLHLPLKQWSSTSMCWENKIDYAKKVVAYGKFERGGWLSFNITDFIKESVLDSKPIFESRGLVLKGGESYKILATSDNEAFIPYLVITTSRPPLMFNTDYEINPN